MSEEGNGESPVRRPRRTIRRVTVLSSDTDTESDGSVAPPATRRKRPRVLSDDGSDSSGSSIVMRRKRTLPKLRDSEADSDTSGWATDHSDAVARPPSTGANSDSSDGNSDKCSICLLRFRDQEVGTPQTCEHIFCLDCIIEWSRNVNTCPVDRLAFTSIVVRACAGGRVLRTEPVKAPERRPSVELLVEEDPTPCEICRSTENEENMLLCDSCDLGYHMQCLTPPLTEVPTDEWHCPNCDALGAVRISELDDLFSDIVDLELPLEPRAVPLRAPRQVRRSGRQREGEPSTSRGRGAADHVDEAPSTSRARSRGTARRAARGRGTTRRKRRRTTQTVIIEYELEESGKFPVRKTVKRKVKKRKSRKRPRTAARRTQVRASVRARLRSLGAGQLQRALNQQTTCGTGVRDLGEQRRRAGLAPLSLFGDPHSLDYFSEEDDHVAEAEGGVAVAARPTSSILSAYRQARRKMISIPSPPHASAAPDLLGSILQSQTLLHSKRSIVSIAVDGKVDIKIQNRDTRDREAPRLDREASRVDREAPRVDREASRTDREALRVDGEAPRIDREPSRVDREASRIDREAARIDRESARIDRETTRIDRETPRIDRDTRNDESGSEKVDLSKGADLGKKAPSYPGGRGGGGGGGGWGGGYRGNYHRDNATGNFSRAYENNYAGHPPAFQNNMNNNSMREEEDGGGFFDRRPPPFARRPDRPDRNDRPDHRYNNHNNHNNHGQQRPDQGRYSTGPHWGGRPEGPLPPQRHSFGGFEAAPLDMRTAPPVHTAPAPPPHQHQHQHPPHQHQHQPPPLQHQRQPHQPLAPPPAFAFSEREEEADQGSLVIDTEKYDPTEPTVDEDSGEEGALPAAATPPTAPPLTPPPPALTPPPVAPLVPPPPPPLLPPMMMAGLSGGVTQSALHSAVQQVLQEHRLLNPSRPQPPSDEDSDGDCPNFSIYSATSVHIANSGNLTMLSEPEQMNLITETEEEEKHPSEPVSPVANVENMDAMEENADRTEVKNKDDEYKAKVSKRCPITTNTRNPIKIKINTVSLVKKTVSLYDDEEASGDVEAERDTEKTENKEVVSSQSDNTPDENVEHDLNKENTELDKELDENDEEKTPEIKQPSDIEDDATKLQDELDEEDDKSERGKETASDKDDASDRDDDNASEELRAISRGSKDDEDKNNEGVEKMTESISETEDERSYTPCLDENKSKDTSLETDKDKNLEGLDTEMISEEEGNDMFSDAEKAASETEAEVEARPAPGDEEGEIVDKKKEDDGKKKKKKESKKEGKDKKSKKKADVSFKKLSKSGKERNYRDKKDNKEKDDAEAIERKRRKEKRKDLERYDVRTVVTEKRNKVKDAFGRDVSPPTSPLRRRSISPRRRSISPRRRSITPRRKSISPRRRSITPRRKSISPRRRSISPRRRSITPRRRSISPRRISLTPRKRTVSPRRRSISPRRRSISPRRRSISPRRRSISPRRRSPSPHKAARRSASPRKHKSASPPRKRRKSASPRRKRVARRRRSVSKTKERKRRRSASPAGAGSPKPKPGKKKKRRASPPPAKKTKRKRNKRLSRSPSPVVAREWSPASVDSRLLSPRTPPPARRPARHQPPPAKEVFTSGDNILVSVSFKDQDRDRTNEATERRRRRTDRRMLRRARRRAAAAASAPQGKPVAIIDLERSPFAEIPPSPRPVIVLSDASEPEADAPQPAVAEPAPAPAAAHAHAPAPAAGPKTPPSPSAAGAAAPSPDAYDPFEPTRSPSPAATPPRPAISLETAQKTNLSADDVIDRRPITPIEKVMALLQSTRDVSPDPPPSDSQQETDEKAAAAAAPAAAPAPAPPPALLAPPAPAPAPAPPVRIVLPSPTRTQPKLFLAKPSPIKSNPVKPMQATKISRLPLPAVPALPRRDEGSGGDSPYSPGSSDFGELFSPPGGRRRDAFDALLPERGRRGPKVPVKLAKKKGNKTQVGVKIDEDSLKILDDLPSSAVEMQVKSKFLKKLNRQERVVEEVKLVLKPHYNRKRVTKEQYKQIMRRAVPKICHNKTGEINPTKIQALVEAYVKKFRKKQKQGLA